MKKINYYYGKFLVFFSQGYGPLINFILFKLLSDVLSVSDMGNYITIYALAFFFTTFIGLGYSYYVFKNLAHNPGLVSFTWGRLIYLDFLTFIVSIPFYLFFTNLWVNDSVSVYTLCVIFVTESLVVVLINDASLIFQALQAFRDFSIIKIAFSTIRLLAVLPISVGLLSFEDPLLGYYVLSFIALVLFYIAILIYTGSKFAFPKVGIYRWSDFGSFKDGILYSIGNFSKTAYNDMDKIMLNNIAGPYEAGLYGVIYRIATSIKLPLDSYLLITFPHYFKLSHRNVKLSYLYYLKKLKWYIVFAVVSMGAAFTFAWILPYVFPKYEAGNILLVVFSLSFLLKGIYLPLADILTSSGRQALRTTLQVLVGFLNVGLNFYFIRKYGMYGALYSTMISEVVLMILLAREVKKSIH